ncbi:general secretion pathway protein GspB [Solimonas sp. SE-A11]|uniref:general secretion pathway protein GspB n=1 Tax=Solimonas sp. SE-A11 TaxID=3054954 RepID=UPI00259C7960|nr:general secretion pathway protein GspB [Solimonas sp. SE-A11]MDM4770000.1 general secretion pathway protein GspB [Solimonas sp. SE-A11]
MSYILDALRKAERERNLGQPPSMQAVTQPSALHRPQRRPLWPLLLGLAVLMLIATAATLAWQRHRAPAAVAPAEATPDRAPAAALPAPAPGAVSSFDDLAPPEPALPPVEEEEMPAEVAAPPPPAARAAPAEAPPVQEEELVEEPATMAEPVLPLVRDMPPSWRAAFPQLTVEVHVYNHSRDKRWVMIGSRRYREGEALAEGPRLIEITPDGIVFEQQGQRALYPITR